MNANTSSVVQDCESEPLYLMVDGDNDVYVNNFLMEQHQIDGLRFLFKQFNKKAPGVIVNFPASCGKSATVAIFLNAVTNVLKNPVLILCQNDADLEYWKEVLIKWSSYVEDDIVLESSNPFIKGKKVFIKKCESLHSYLRRRWSVIILKENFVHKDMFKHNFEADFRICITATDIKKDLSLLNAVYKWLYPKKVTNFNDFVAKENRPKEKFRKSVQLDFLLEDVAIRRYVNVKPFQADEKRLIESLGLNSDCPDTRKSVKENNNLTRLNEYKDVDNLIKEESTESLSFDSNCRFDKNEIRDLGSDLIKEESSNSSNEVNSSNVDPNEKKDLHNKNVLQKQLIESLGLDDVKDEIEETNDEPNDVTENMQNVVEQIATGLEDDEIIVIKIEPEDENVNIVSNKRKSDKSGKDLDSKISEMEEKALKKFKGSLLDSIF